MFCRFYSLRKLLFVAIYCWSLRQRERILVTFKQLIIKVSTCSCSRNVVELQEPLLIVVLLSFRDRFLSDSFKN